MSAVTRKNIQILMLALVLLGSLALSLFPWYQQSQAQAEALSARQLMPTQAATQIHILPRQGSQITLQKHNGQWLMQQPQEAPANPERVELVLSLLQLPATSAYTTNDVDGAISGLNQPLYSVTIDAHEFHFGNLIEETQQRYFRYQDQVWLVNDMLVPFLNAGPAALIQPDA